MCSFCREGTVVQLGKDVEERRARRCRRATIKAGNTRSRLLGSGTLTLTSDSVPIESQQPLVRLMRY
jgi:hypothetical protein